MIEISDPILYLSRKDVEAVDLSMPEIIDALDRMFKEKGEGRECGVSSFINAML